MLLFKTERASAVRNSIFGCMIVANNSFGAGREITSGFLPQRTKVKPLKEPEKHYLHAPLRLQVLRPHGKRNEFIFSEWVSQQGIYPIDSPRRTSSTAADSASCFDAFFDFNLKTKRCFYLLK